jgi:outer membrane protein OmpA-like peptidoglycan-associated protein
MKRHWLQGLAWLAIAGFATSCMTYDPYTDEKKVSKSTWGTAIGAAGGAAAGAAIGAATGDNKKERRKRAAIGAGAGAAAGAITGGTVGYYMDKQDAELRQRLRGTGVSVTRNGQEIILNMPGNITFQVDRDEIRPGFFETLGSVAIVLREYDQTQVEVSGHTDSTGSDEHNRDLSQRRAESVAEYLASQGIARERLVPEGYGEAYPIADNGTESGRAQNRRVEIRLSPLAGAG